MLYSERFVIYNLKSLKLSRRSIKAEFRHRMNNSELNFSNLLAQYSDIREMPTDNVPEQNDWYSFFWNNGNFFIDRSMKQCRLGLSSSLLRVAKILYQLTFDSLRNSVSTYKKKFIEIQFVERRYSKHAKYKVFWRW
jgi:hypothetical protein